MPRLRAFCSDVEEFEDSGVELVGVGVEVGEEVVDLGVEFGGAVVAGGDAGVVVVGVEVDLFDRRRLGLCGRRPGRASASAVGGGAAGQVGAHDRGDRFASEGQ